VHPGKPMPLVIDLCDQLSAYYGMADARNKHRVENGFKFFEDASVDLGGGADHGEQIRAIFGGLDTPDGPRPQPPPPPRVSRSAQAGGARQRRLTELFR